MEKAWYTLEGEHYGAHWSELYEKDSLAEEQREAFDKLTDSAQPPYQLKQEAPRHKSRRLREESVASALSDWKQKQGLPPTKPPTRD